MGTRVMTADSFGDHLVTSIESLEALYGEAKPASLAKEIDHVSDHYRALIEAAPFMALATSGPDGLDCSPRGDAPGFVHVRDATTLLVPDRRGNNRIDSLRNLIRDPGSPFSSSSPAALRRCASMGAPPFRPIRRLPRASWSTALAHWK